NGTYTVQVANALSNATYFLRVRAGTPGATGNYDLTVGFGHQAEDFTTFAGSALTPAKRQDTYNFYVAKTQLFDFVLSSNALSVGSTYAVQLTIVDAQGKVRYSLTAQPGQTVSDRSLFLAPGAYSVRFTAIGTGTLPPSLGYTLRGKTL